MDTKEIFLAELTSHLEHAKLKFDLENDGVTVYNSESTPTIVRIEKVGFKGLDGREISYSVRVSKHCANPDSDLFDLNNLGRWNVYTSILSAIKDAVGLKVFARLNLYEGAPEVIKHVYAPLVYWAVWLAPGLAAYLETGQPNAVGFMRKIAPRVEPWWFGIPDDAANEPPPFTEADFSEGIAFARERGVLCNGGAEGLTVEFPWDPGATGEMYEVYKEAAALGKDAEAESADSSEPSRKRTSLLMIENNQPHPLFGKGTLLRFQVPFTTKPEKVAALVNDMNLWESNVAEMTPFFGSWCIDPSFSSPAYVMFLPSMLGRATSIPSLINWMHSRHRASMGYLNKVRQNAKKFELNRRQIDILTEREKAEGMSEALEKEWEALCSETAIAVLLGPNDSLKRSDKSEDREYADERDLWYYNDTFSNIDYRPFFNNEYLGNVILEYEVRELQGMKTPVLRISFEKKLDFFNAITTPEKKSEIDLQIKMMTMVLGCRGYETRLETVRL